MWFDAPNYALYDTRNGNDRLRSKPPQGLLFPLGLHTLFGMVWFHPVPRGDSGDLIAPFMHVGI